MGFKVNDKVYVISIAGEDHDCRCCGYGTVVYYYAQVLNKPKKIIKIVKKNGKILYDVGSVWLYEYCAKTRKKAYELAEQINQRLINEHLDKLKKELEKFYNSNRGYYYYKKGGKKR